MGVIEANGTIWLTQSLYSYVPPLLQCLACLWLNYDPDQYAKLWHLASFKKGVLDNDGNMLPVPQPTHDKWEYIWQCPHAVCDHLHSMLCWTSVSTSSGCISPIKDSGGGVRGCGSGGGGGGGGGGAVLAAAA